MEQHPVIKRALNTSTKLLKDDDIYKEAANDENQESLESFRK